TEARPPFAAAREAARQVGRETGDMFGKRSSGGDTVQREAPRPAQPASAPAAPASRAPQPAAAQPSFKPTADDMGIPSPSIAPSRTPPPVIENRRSESFYETKGQIFGALIEAIDLTQLSKLDPLAAREEIRDIVNEIIAIKNFAMSISEQ